MACDREIQNGRGGWGHRNTPPVSPCFFAHIKFYCPDPKLLLQSLTLPLCINLSVCRGYKMVFIPKPSLNPLSPRGPLNPLHPLRLGNPMNPLSPYNPLNPVGFINPLSPLGPLSPFGPFTVLP
eukprot:g842.t1